MLHPIFNLGPRLLLPFPLPANAAVGVTLRDVGKLLMLVLAIKLSGDWAALLGLAGSFNPYGFTDIATQLFLLVACAWLWTLVQGPTAGLRLLTLAASAWPLTLLLDSFGAALLLHTDATPDTGVGYQLGLAVPITQGIILLRALVATTTRQAPTHWLLAIALTALFLSNRAYLPNEALWITQPREDPTLTAYSQLDLETLWAEQPSLLEAQFSGLQAPDGNQSDTYFLGFSAYPYQNVFKRETERAQTLFAQHYGTAQRSLMLVNHIDTYATLPLATVANLNLALTQLGGGLDVSDDVLVLYLSSHGMETGELTVEFGDLPLNNLTPETLRAALDSAGIRWRIIIISACYSGAFTPVLADSHSLIITAARADRASFGCDDTTEFTYFGQALLDALAQNDDLKAAFQLAATEVRKREQREFPGEPPSEPQFVLGEALAQKLPELQAHWRTLRPQQAAPNQAALTARLRP